MRGGRCLCGSVSYEFDPSRVRWRGHCHCESCRRACSAPVTAFFGVRDDGWRWTGADPAVHASSDHAERLFCGHCGSQMAYRSTRHPGEIHFHAASLDDPADFAPEWHFHWSERLQWLHLADDLPRKG